MVTATLPVPSVFLHSSLPCSSRGLGCCFWPLSFFSLSCCQGVVGESHQQALWADQLRTEADPILVTARTHRCHLEGVSSRTGAHCRQAGAIRHRQRSRLACRKATTLRHARTFRRFPIRRIRPRREVRRRRSPASITRTCLTSTVPTDISVRRLYHPGWSVAPYVAAIPPLPGAGYQGSVHPLSRLAIADAVLTVSL